MESMSELPSHNNIETLRSHPLDYDQISSCDQNEDLQNLLIERITSPEEIRKSPGKTYKSDSCEEHVSRVTEENIQLEIWTPTDSAATRKRYFVSNGDRGEKWLQFYFQGCDTSGILLQSQIKEREVSFEHINNFKNLFPGKVLYKDYKMEESKDFQSSENMDLSGIFAANRNILKSVCRLLKKSKRTLFQKKTQNKYLKPPRGGDQNKTETQESTPVEVSNLNKDSKDTTSLQNEWLIHLVLGNLPRDGGLRLIETDTPNTTESDHGTEEKNTEEYSSTNHSLWATIKQIFTRRSRRVRNEDVENSGVNLQLKLYC